MVDSSDLAHSDSIITVDAAADAAVASAAASAAILRPAEQIGGLSEGCEAGDN